MRSKFASRILRPVNVGLACAAGCAALGVAGGLWAIRELHYVNRYEAVPPVDASPLLIRSDAKGDGAYQAPRSGGRLHRGVDLSAPMGSPVRAVRSGRVIEQGTHRGLGRYVVLDHGGGMVTLYAHMSDTLVRSGERVRQGQQVGAIGKTGNAGHRLIDPHVHFEVHLYGEAVDPARLGLAWGEATGDAPG